MIYFSYRRGNDEPKRGLWITYAIFMIAAFPVVAGAAAPADFDSLQKRVMDLQHQIAGYQNQIREQSKKINIQGEEMARLKNRLEAVEEKAPSAAYPVPDSEAFKKGVFDTLQAMRLSEKKETPEGQQLRTIYDDGFYLKGKDDTLKIGGWYQGDAIFYDRKNEGNNRFRNRRARLDVRGVLEDVFEYRLFSEFAGSAASLQEAWLMYKHFSNARIKFGQFIVPFSLEGLYSVRWLDFVERSLGVSNLQPAEDLGLMIFGTPFGGVMEYGAGVFNGRLRTLDDNNDNFDMAGRIVFAPFKKMNQPLFREFYIGSSMTAGHSDETLAGTGFTTSGGSRFVTYATNTRHADRRIRYGGELQWIYGPGDIKAEYAGATFHDVERVDLKDDVRVNSWYASASYVLTGEKKVRDRPIEPRHVFSIKDGGWGAWETALRLEQFFVDDSPFSTGLVTGTGQVNSFTAGLNWWPNKHIRLMFDYTFNDFADPVLAGSETLDSESLFLSRVQYNF